MKKTGNLHEDYSRQDGLQQGSDRSFGLVFTGAFTVLALVPLLHGAAPRWWALAVAALFLLTAWLRPKLLKPLNRLWALVGLVLQHVVGRVVIAVLFYAIITPIGLLRRRFGDSPIREGFEPARETYWEPRSSPAPDSMRRQF